MANPSKSFYPPKIYHIRRPGWLLQVSDDRARGGSRRGRRRVPGLSDRTAANLPEDQSESRALRGKVLTGLRRLGVRRPRPRQSARFCADLPEPAGPASASGLTEMSPEWHNQGFSQPETRLADTMTMLDRMRRHKNWLKWSLAIVVVAFIALYIPELHGEPALDAASPYGVVATVDGRTSPSPASAAPTSSRCRLYRNAYGGQHGRAPAAAARHRSADRAAADRRGGGAGRSAAARASRRATPKCARASSRCRRSRRTATSSATSATGSCCRCRTRRSTRASSKKRSGAASLVEKLQGALTDWITVADSDVDAEFKRRNEKVKLAVVSFPADKFQDGGGRDRRRDRVALRGATRSTYQIPEKRKIQYALIDIAGIRQRTTVSAAGRAALLRRQPAAVLDARAGARQPHPASRPKARTTPR